MKKLLGFIVAALLIFGLAGQGMADFSDFQLIRVVYDTNYDVVGKPTGGSKEIATDLGNINTILSSGNGQILGAGSGVRFTDFTTAAWANLRVAYFAVTNASQLKAWVSASSMPSNNDFAFEDLFLPEATQVFTNWGGSSAATTVDKLQSAPNSYWKMLNDGGIGVGKFNSFLTANVGEISLSTMATSLLYNGKHYVDTQLWYFADGNSAGQGVLAGTLRTMEDGSTIYNPTAAPVPIPPSVVLLGAGLLGLIGIRRRSA